MIRLLAAGLLGASLVGGFILYSGGTVVTEAQSTPSTPRALKGDRLDARPYGQACSQETWPYYEPKCLRNTIAGSRVTQPVRIVTTDRLRGSVD
jgi:hypothetical protein